MAAMQLVRVQRRGKKRRPRYQGARVAGPKRIRGAQRGFLRVGGFYGRYANGGELKFFDQGLTDAVVSAAGTVQSAGSMINIAQGVTESTRVGRKCVLKSLQWNYQLALTETAGAALTGGDTVRIIVYLDKQCNGATIAVTDLMESDNYQSFYNLANTGRFQVLYDKSHDINPMAGAGDGAANDQAKVVRNFKFFKRCNLPIEYSATTGAIAEIRSNNIGILTLSALGLTELDSLWRVRFADG